MKAEGIWKAIKQTAVGMGRILARSVKDFVAEAYRQGAAQTPHTEPRPEDEPTSKTPTEE